MYFLASIFYKLILNSHITVPMKKSIISLPKPSIMLRLGFYIPLVSNIVMLMKKHSLKL